MNCKENCHPHINRVSQSGLQTTGHQNLLWHADSWVSSQLISQMCRVKPSQICSVTISAGESHKHTLKSENHCLRKKCPQLDLQIWQEGSLSGTSILCSNLRGQGALQLSCMPEGRPWAGPVWACHASDTRSCDVTKSTVPSQLTSDASKMSCRLLTRLSLDSGTEHSCLEA